MTAGSLSERMLSDQAAAFDAMVAHPFVRDLVADRLPMAAFNRYLLIEGAFVDTAIAIFGYAVAKASDLDDRRKLIASLDGLAHAQMDYFRNAHAQRGLDPDPNMQLDPRVAAFRDGMLAIARDGDLADILTAMFAAEWMYWTWCDAHRDTRLRDPVRQDWIALHTAPEFHAQALWLRDRVDRLGTDLPVDRQTALVALFGHVQRLEIAFHDVAWSGET
ncbi:TenA family transcriptional regulator (plasmid) [Paracoccus liaowanqingii]|uniref:Aminopyrimidine aminohydrolase n=1 Tax=Paracoccus liaowanqingii TaxID=2560053 RepID=A0A4Y5SS04_9RHOB|nr:TenA family protein [Paracoccus liaowanqingii]QDA36280.1 TenA family transcriptional regulator [Paracoccus liaowanqingii]